jgi:acyl-CoA thioesterase
MATTDEADVEIARRHAERMYAGDEASCALGIILADVGPGKATVRMRVLPSMVNGHGVGHGGYLFLLADTAFAFACNTYGPVTVARNCEIASSGRWSQGKS